VRQWYNDNKSIGTPNKYYIPEGDVLNESRNINMAYTFRYQLSYNRSFASRHHVTAIAGGEVNKDVLDNNFFPNPRRLQQPGRQFYQLQTIVIIMPASTCRPAWAYRLQGTHECGQQRLRDNASYRGMEMPRTNSINRFILSSSLRMDLTNFFGTDPRYRYRPTWSVGGTYKLANEKFFPLPASPRLNLRGSYGIMGNISLGQGPFPDHEHHHVGVSNFTGAFNTSILTPPNNSLRWERTRTINVGLDVAVLRNRLRVTADYYHRLSTDLLSPEPTILPWVLVSFPTCSEISAS